MNTEAIVAIVILGVSLVGALVGLITALVRGEMKKD